MGDVMDRCPTGIKGFDRLCQGGFVRNSDNLLVGGPGSGKTTFLLEFLWNGATMFNENGIYCSFEPDVVEILKDGMVYGWDFTKLNNEGKIKFVRFAPQTSIEELKSELTKLISKGNIKRICFDPISVIAMNYGDVGKIRQTIFELSSLMKRLKVTSIFADENFDEEIGSGNNEMRIDVLRFLSDSVTIFYESNIAGVGDRALRIVKMRRTSHERKAVGMRINKRGIEVIDPSLVIGEIPSSEDDYAKDDEEETEQQEIKETYEENSPLEYEKYKKENEPPKVEIPTLQTSDQTSLPDLGQKKPEQQISKQPSGQYDNLNKAKEFIGRLKLKGYSDEQIKEMFIQKGWSTEQIGKLFLEF